MRTTTLERRQAAQTRREAMYKIVKRVGDMSEEERQAFFVSRQIVTIEGRVLSLTNG